MQCAVPERWKTRFGKNAGEYVRVEYPRDAEERVLLALTADGRIRPRKNRRPI